ncbi:MAG: dienelactone hydrolase [Deltaproteobacteria bacterium RBG_16_71_12]|nr:MAG: dienelactone hydrolase [Deltaproteobacteria bacterium RBG_16_71_12]
MVTSAVRCPHLSLAVILLTSLSAPALAAIKSEKVEHRDAAGAVLEGVLVYDDAVKGARPGVLVVHDWMGVTEITETRAKELAAMGYVAFAADIYGKGTRPRDAKEASTFAGKYKGDRKLLRSRAQAGLDVLAKNKNVDAKKLAAIGFCFGGTTAIELARSGALLRGVVSFHGGLDAPTPGDGKNIKGKVLVLHGADDPYVPAADIAAFKKDLNDAMVDWTMTEYAGTVHSFTIPSAGNDNSKGAAYNERSSKRAFAAMKAFFDEIFAG